jgi:hypothetical protein
MTLFEHPQERYPEQYAQVLRTLQCRVQEWQALHGEARDVMFEFTMSQG